MTRWQRRAALVFSAALMMACEDDPTAIVRVDRVEVGPEDVVLVVGDSTTITAVPQTSGGDIVVGPVLWRTLSPTVATLSVTGGTAVVKAVSAGVVRIEAESGGVTGYTDVTVVAVAQVAQVTLLPTTFVLEPDQEVTLQAVATTAAGEAIMGRAVTWAVTGTGVTVTPDAQNGWATVTAHTDGNAVVSATVDGVTGEAEIQVVTSTPPPAQVATVEITPSGFSLMVNTETPLQAIAKDAFGAVIFGREITWVSVSEAVATITPIGASAYASLVAKAPGTAVIRATIDGVTAEVSIPVTAVPPPPGAPVYMFFSVPRRGIWINQTLDIRQHLAIVGQTGEPVNAQVSWSVADASIVTVNANGHVTGVSAGTTTVRATVGDVFAVATVTVFAPAGDPAVYDLTSDWWDGQWRLQPQIGTGTWTDDSGAQHQIALWPMGGSFTMTGDGTYRRTIVQAGFNQFGEMVLEQEIVDNGTYTILVGGESGYRMYSTSTPGYEFTVVSGFDAGHLLMRAVVGTAAEYSYLLRLRQ
jgi:hypothetical protein